MGNFSKETSEMIPLTMTKGRGKYFVVVVCFFLSLLATFRCFFFFFGFEFYHFRCGHLNNS